MKVAELSGAKLDYWVAKAEGLNAAFHSYAYDPTRSVGDQWSGGPYIYSFSTDWQQGGPIMERERMDFNYMGGGEYEAHIHPARISRGKSMLIAAMRCYVASKFGPEVPDVE